MAVMSDGNIDHSVSRLLEDRLDEMRRLRLRDALRFGYESEAVHDLEVAGQYRFVDAEMAQHTAAIYRGSV